MPHRFSRVFAFVFACCFLQLTGLAAVAAAGSSATFLRFDTTTQGNWKGVYGADGYAIANDSQVNPSYAPSFAALNQGNGWPFPDDTLAIDTLTWANNPADPRALQRGSVSGTIAAAWFVNHFAYPPDFSFSVPITDGNTHQFAVYVLNWDNEPRSESIQILDANTNAVLDTRYLSDFVNGVYAVWNISGSVIVNVTTISDVNSQGVASGVFFGGAPSGISYSVAVSPSNIGLNANQSQQFTAMVSGTVSQNVIWSINPSIGSISGSGFYTAPGGFANGQVITVTAASVAAPSQTGTAKITLTNGPVANYVGSDTSTMGNWPGVYGIDGYSVAGDSQSIPSYGSFTLQGQSNVTWAANPSDSRALKTGNNLGRIAAAWTSSSSFSFGAGVTDGNLHQISLYALDWNNQGINETIQVLDTNNNLLDTRTISNFSQGIYLAWNVSGNVVFKVIQNSGGSAVLSGVFWGHGDLINVSVNPTSALLTAGQTAQFAATVLGTANSNVVWSISPPSLGSILTTGLYVAPSVLSSNQTVTVTATSMQDPTRSGSATVNLATGAGVSFLGTDTVTGGNWQTKYGADGYAMANQSATNPIVTQSIPPYAALNIQSPSGFMLFWNFTTTDPRALELPDNSGRIAAAWWMYRNHDPFYYDVNFTDGNPHQIAFYSVDFDGTGRIQTYEIQDANTGAILDTRTISNFTGGIYLIWQVVGHVTVNITEDAGTNAVVSGLFFGGTTPSINVSVFPPTTSLEAGQTLQFSTAVTGTSNLNVAWSIVSPSGPAAGTLSSAGLYQAPSTVSTAQTVTIAAKSAANGTTFGTATINLSTKTVASFVGFDTTTQGNWYGAYGIDGFSVANYLQSIPTYATFGVQNAMASTWVPNSGDPRALLTGDYTGRIASDWNSSSAFNFDINFTDGKSHQLAFYALDWDSYPTTRGEVVQVVDATTNALLDTRNIYNFVNGIYLVWNVSGHIKINVYETTGGTGVISGVFFGGGNAASTYVSVKPQTVSLQAGQMQQFTAQVVGSSNQNVTWAINNPGPGTGTISATGLYTAPSPISSNQTVTITATSAGGTAVGTANVILTTGAVANFLGLDPSTQGNWHGSYGTDGYVVVNDSQSIPSYAALNVQNAFTYTWVGDTTQARALQTASGTGRIAAGWYNNPTFTFDINITDGNLHQVALYLLDWDSAGGVRAENIYVLDANTNAVLDTESISNSVGGVYVPWNISGHVKINVTVTNGNNGVVSGLFFGAAANAGPIHMSVTPQNVSLASGQNQQFAATLIGTLNQVVTWAIANQGPGNISAAGGLYTAPTSISSPQTVTITATSSANNSVVGTASIHLTTGAVANFTGLDTTTQGNWQSAYGGDGYAIANYNQALPGYVASFAATGGTPFTWASSTSDVRALRIPGTSAGIATAWYNNPAFSFDINITDGKLHQVALYALDWDSYGGVRAENVQVVDANTGTVLDNQNISTFTGGVYLVWNLSGHVMINLTMTAGANAIASGVFFGGPPSATPAFTSVNNATFAVGTAGAFTVSATGIPLPALTETGALPSGVTFVDNGNGTGTLSGTPTTTSGSPFGLTFKATNSTTATQQPFTLSLSPAPVAPSFTSGNSTSFIVGTPGTFTVSASGLPTPTLTATGALPSGVTFVDNGNGTGTLSGTPTTASGSPFGITFKATNSSSSVTQGFTLTVSSAPVAPSFTSGNSATFTVGTPGTFTVSASGIPTPTFTETGALPSGVTFVGNGNGTGTLSGTPTTTSGSPFVITLKATNSVSTIPQTFTVTVNPAPAGPSASFVTFDTSTQGNWRSKYGADGYSIANYAQSLLSYGTFAVQNASPFTWAGTTSDPRALLMLGSSTAIASAWYSKPSFSIDVNLTDGQVHQVAVYALDWDSYGGVRGETMQVLDANNPSHILDTETLSSYTTGTYVVWNVSGHVTINVILTAGTNAVVSGVFFEPLQQIAPTITSANNTAFSVGASGTFTVTATGNPLPTLSESGALPSGVAFNTATGVLSGTPASGTNGSYPLTFTASNGVSPNAPQTFTLTVNKAAGTAVTFIGQDTSSGGNWQGKYGADGVALANVSPQNLPSYAATFQVENQGNYTWVVNPSDPRALQTGSGTARIAACWYSGTTFTFDVNFADGNTHQFALYAVDWDSSGRSDTVQIVDATTSNQLDLRTISNFTPGAYLVWNISGHVKINVTSTGGTNAVVSGVFFGPQTPPVAPAITSANGTTFTVGTFGTFTVTATGIPSPTLSESGTLPSGVTFNASTTVLSGTPTSGTNGSYPLTFTASNGVSPNAPQTFTLTVSQPVASTVTFVGQDTTTGGNWEGVYGADGSALANVTPQNLPSYAATFQVVNQGNYTWVANPTDPRALETGSGTARIAACWYSGTTFTFDVNFADGNTHQFALYAVDWDSSGRADTVQIVDATTGNQLDLRTISSFTPGAYLVWNISGHVKINVTSTGGTNAVVSGVFFGPQTPPVAPAITSANGTTLTVGTFGTFTVKATGIPSPTLSESGTLPSGVTFNASTNVLSGTPASGTNGSYPITFTASNGVNPNAAPNFTLTVNPASVGGSGVTFAGFDTTTQGNWQLKYGSDGYSIANFTQSLPIYATLTPQNAQLYTWFPTTSDVRALKMPNSSVGIASTWYNTPSFSYDVNITDGNTHQIALYALDWDSYGGVRAETIQIVDANNPSNVLDSESLPNYQNGVYLVWNISKHVKINVTLTSGVNAAISGVFFGGGATASFVKADTSTQGSWLGNYGVDGYAMPNVGQSIPSYAVFAVQNQSNYTWAASTSDVRALLLPGGGGAIASTWYAKPTFNLDINLMDGNMHQIAVYALDWDSYGGVRAETIQVVDANSNAVLDTENLPSCTTGTYLVWNITGHVRINVTLTNGANAVISGVFFK